MEPLILLAFLLGATKVIANDCAIAKSAWPEMFGIIDATTCCDSDGTVSGVNCPPDVSCDVRCKNGSITEIQLNYGMGIQTDSPFPDLSGLTQLTYLFLVKDFTGALPTIWPPALQKLELTSSTLTGPFPAFNQTTALTVLLLENTKIAGSIPALPTTLKALMLVNNILIGSISVLPPSIGSIYFIESGMGAFPPLKALKNLTNIGIENCNFTGTFPDFPDTIKEVSIETTKFTGPLPAFPDSLEEIFFRDTMQSGLLPDLPTLLKELYISNLQLTGILPSLYGLSKLTSFAIMQTKMSGSIPNLPSTLGGLSLYGNNFNGSIPSLPQALESLKRNLGGNHFSGTIPTFLPPQLVEIDLSNNNFSGFIPQSILNLTDVYLDANCFINADDYNVTNVCASTNTSQGGYSIAALTDNEYLDKAMSYKDTLFHPCLSPCQEKIPSYSNLTSFNATCLDIQANPNSMKPLIDCASKHASCSLLSFSAVQTVEIFVKILESLCQQFLQPTPSTAVTNNTLSFDIQNVGLLGFQAFVSTDNGTFIAGSKFDISKPLNIPVNSSRKRDDLETQTIHIPCGLKASVLHMKYVVDDSVIALSDPNKLGHVKQIEVDLTASESGSECQGQSVPVVTTTENLPIKTTAVAVPVLPTAVIIPPTSMAIIAPQVVTTAELAPPTTITTASPIIELPVVATTVALSANIPPPVATTVFVSDTNSSGAVGSDSSSGSSGNQGGTVFDNTVNNGGSVSVGSGKTGSDTSSGNTAGNSAGNSVGNNLYDGNTNTVAVTSNSGDTSKPVQPVTPATVGPQQTSALSSNTGLLQVTSAKAQTIVASVLSISSSFGPVDATELQNSLVSVDKDVVAGATLVTVAAPSFPKATGGMNKIVLSVESNSFKILFVKFPSSSGQVQTYNEASSSGSRTVCTAQGSTATIVLTLPDLVNTLVYGFQLSDPSETFIISVFKADDSRTPLAKISYSVQAQGTKRDGGKITVVMGVAKVRAEMTTSAVTVVSPAKTVGSVGVQVLIPSSAVCKSIEMAIPFLWPHLKKKADMNSSTTTPTLSWDPRGENIDETMLGNYIQFHDTIGKRKFYLSSVTTDMLVNWRERFPIASPLPVIVSVNSKKCDTVTCVLIDMQQAPGPVKPQVANGIFKQTRIMDLDHGGIPKAGPSTATGNRA
ncbi:L domain-like protein [Rhizoclosmatium globosum]|uniref:L domain-like protein n=1 Tax=Rhizoclosmatium globosum TaxID=329046 RepID=A0A1Y2CNE6_9FUNG|nr:L domain-like protein [Rhizoclosmatium globosum]|eukprot:ORY48466.1 L domain-like protein [Rhizoclosmatium globosum]